MGKFILLNVVALLGLIVSSQMSNADPLHQENSDNPNTGFRRSEVPVDPDALPSDEFKSRNDALSEKLNKFMDENSGEYLRAKKEKGRKALDAFVERLGLEEDKFEGSKLCICRCAQSEAGKKEALYSIDAKENSPSPSQYFRTFDSYTCEHYAVGETQKQCSGVSDYRARINQDGKFEVPNRESKIIIPPQFKLATLEKGKLASCQMFSPLIQPFEAFERWLKSKTAESYPPEVTRLFAVDPVGSTLKTKAVMEALLNDPEVLKAVKPLKAFDWGYGSRSPHFENGHFVAADSIKLTNDRHLEISPEAVDQYKSVEQNVNDLKVRLLHRADLLKNPLKPGEDDIHDPDYAAEVAYQDQVRRSRIEADEKAETKRQDAASAASNRRSVELEKEFRGRGYDASETPKGYPPARTQNTQPAARPKAAAVRPQNTAPVVYRDERGQPFFVDTAGQRRYARLVNRGGYLQYEW
jgi:hypothetical protein